MPRTGAVEIERKRLEISSAVKRLGHDISKRVISAFTNASASKSASIKSNAKGRKKIITGRVTRSDPHV